MKNAKALLLGISVIYFNDESKNIYYTLLIMLEITFVRVLIIFRLLFSSSA